MSAPVKVKIPCYCWQEKKVGRGAIHCTEPPHTKGKHYHWPTRTSW